MDSLSIGHWIAILVTVLFAASPLFGIVRGVKNGSVLHAVVSYVVPVYGLIYFFAARRAAPPRL